jgi:predicted TPR repeat methyltransferase
MSYTKCFVYYYDLFKDEKDCVENVAKLILIFKRHKVKSVLDIGCGTGKIDSLLINKLISL